MDAADADFGAGCSDPRRSAGRHQSEVGHGRMSPILGTPDRRAPSSADTTMIRLRRESDLLGTSSDAILQYLAACGQFSRHILSLRKQALSAPFSTTDMQARAASGSGASARAVTISMDSGAIVRNVFDPHRVDNCGSARRPAPPRAETSPSCRCSRPGGLSRLRLSASAQAMTIPGNPAPDPRSAQTSACGAKSQELERVGDVPRPDHRDRSSARSGWSCVRPGDQQLDEAVEPRRCFT